MEDLKISSKPSMKNIMPKNSKKETYGKLFLKITIFIYNIYFN